MVKPSPCSNQMKVQKKIRETSLKKLGGLGLVPTVHGICPFLVVDRLMPTRLASVDEL